MAAYNNRKYATVIIPKLYDNRDILLCDRLDRLHKNDKYGDKVVIDGRDIHLNIGFSEIKEFKVYISYFKSENEFKKFKNSVEDNSAEFGYNFVMSEIFPDIKTLEDEVDKNNIYFVESKYK